MHNAYGAMSRHLSDLPLEREHVAVTWTDEGPRVVGFAGGVLIVLGCRLEEVRGQASPLATTQLRYAPVDAKATRFSVDTTFRGRGDDVTRTCRWRFEIPGEEPFELTGEVWAHDEPDTAQRVALAIAAHAGLEEHRATTYVLG
jgi:hypothetical protein